MVILAGLVVSSAARCQGTGNTTPGLKVREALGMKSCLVPNISMQHFQLPGLSQPALLLKSLKSMPVERAHRPALPWWRPHCMASVSIQWSSIAAVLAAGLHRLLSLQTNSAPMKPAGSICNWQPLPSRILTVEALKYLTFTLFWWVTFNYLRISTLISWPSQHLHAENNSEAPK